VKSLDQVPRDLSAGLSELLNTTRHLTGAHRQALQILDKWPGTAETLYQPTNRLLNRLDDYERWHATRTGEDPGQLLEEIALLAFQCIPGCTDFLSFRSFASQVDLIVNGSDGKWRLFMYWINGSLSHSSVAIECKNQKAPIDVQQFSRLCWLVDHSFGHTVGLGVFFAQSGATGFPRRNGNPTRPRKSSLAEAQATQVLSYCKSGKPVVVLEHEDFLMLRHPGALPMILRDKILEIGQWTGRLNMSGRARRIDLPPHLARHVGQ